MKKSEKVVEYYEKLVSSIGYGTICSTEELYKIIDKLDKNGPIAVRSSVVNELINALGDEWLEVAVDETATKRGRMIPRLFSLRVKNEKEMEDLKKVIQEKFSRSSAAKTRASSKTARKVRMPRRATVKKFYDLLVKVSHKGKDGLISFSEISPVNKILLNAWLKSLKPFGLDFSSRIIITTDGVKKLVKFVGPKDMLLQLSSKAKEWFGDDLGAKSVLGLDNKTLLKQKSPIVEHSQDIVYSVAGVLKYHGKYMEYDSLCRILSENFGLAVTKNDLKRVASEFSQFFDGTIRSNSAVLLKDADKNWLEINKKFGPKSSKITLIARIGMSLEEVQKFNSTAEILSVITDTDAIYRLNYDKSIHSLKNLMRLYRTFRGSDKILNDDLLVERLEKEIVIIDSQAYSNNLAYQIETI